MVPVGLLRLISPALNPPQPQFTARLLDAGVLWQWLVSSEARNAAARAPQLRLTPSPPLIYLSSYICLRYFSRGDCHDLASHRTSDGTQYMIDPQRPAGSTIAVSVNDRDGHCQQLHSCYLEICHPTGEKEHYNPSPFASTHKP
jgi:hypothetical protein